MNKKVINMTEEEIQTALETGFPLEGEPFRPLVYLRRVDEPEFGCEGRPEEGPVYGTIWGWDQSGAKTWQVPDWMIITAGLDDRMWIGLRAGQLVCCRAGKPGWKPFPKGKWLTALGIE